MESHNENECYTARQDYLHSKAAVEYENRPFYKGILGKIRKYREERAIRNAVQQFFPESTVLDCPCGNGRWFELLQIRAKKIIGIDYSNEMVEFASKRKHEKCEIIIKTGDAENIPLSDKSVDYVFSYALMKHLPFNVKMNVIKEFSRVAKGRLIISFAVFNPINKILWKIKGSKEYPISDSDILKLAENANLIIGATYKVGLPIIGMEKLIIFERNPENEKV